MYEYLSKEDFDAIVTGELTHRAISLEHQLNGIISDYFVKPISKVKDFNRLLLYRDGLTFQDKIEIVRGMLPLFEGEAEIANLKNLLNKVEEFKSWRNAMAHGLDVSEETDWSDEGVYKIKVEIVTRSGKEKIIEITPESHEKMMEDADNLREKLQEVRERLKRKQK